ncbi:MAG: hypothetical protein U0163_16645 [Gemmatimonadaceae bacterium]
MRASVRLLDPQTSEQLEAETVEVPRAEALTLRERIATQVAEFLRRQVGQSVRLVEDRRQTRSLAAWEAVQRARELSRDGASASVLFRNQDARDLLLRADSLYAVAQALDRAWGVPTVGRGHVAMQLSMVASSKDTVVLGPAPAMIGRAVAYADAALAQGAGAPALALRGYARQLAGTLGPAAGADTLLRLAESDLRAALDERPDDARSWYALGEVLNATGRFSEALTALQTAYDRDAYLTEVADVVELLFEVSLFAERFDDADRWCALGASRFAEGPRFAMCRLTLLGWRGRTPAELQAAWSELRTLESSALASVYASQWGYARYLVAAIAARAGLADSARAIVRDTRTGLQADATRDPALVEEAYAALLLGDRIGASRILGRVVRERPEERLRLTRSPWFRTLAADSSGT